MGLDQELFEGPVDEEFICGICHKVLLNPITAGCRHIFCQTCISRKQKSRTSRANCPYCSAKFTDDFKQSSIEFKIKLLGLHVQCAHKCGQSFCLGELPDHNELCPNAPVDCDNRDKGCKKTVRRRDLKKHLEECDFRNVECEACGHVTMYCNLFTHQSRVRCLEKKLKQQVVRERKNTSQEIQHHRAKLFRDHIRLEQQQRKRLLDHARAANRRPGISPTSTLHVQRKVEFEADSDSDQGVFMTEASPDFTEEELNDDELPRVRTVLSHTPHSSRAGFVLQQCVQCSKLFRSDVNTPQSCRFHTGPIIEVFGGTCFGCGRLDYQPGCIVGFHRA